MQEETAGELESHGVVTGRVAEEGQADALRALLTRA